MGAERQARLFRNGRSQAVRIPREFEFPGKEVVMRKEGDKVVIEPKKRKWSLAKLLASWEPLEDEFPEVPELPHDPPPKF